MIPQIIIVVFSFMVCLILSIPSVILARRMSLIDVPGSAPHKAHSFPTPLAGGILTSLVLFVVASTFNRWLSRDVVVVFAGASIVFGFGVWDDFKGLSALPKLTGQFLASMVLVVFGIQVHFASFFSSLLNIPSGVGDVINIIVTLFWLIGVTNAVNMIDSMDGIVSGLSTLAFICYLGATALADQDALSIWSAALAGISAGLYVGNKLQGKFFLGDSGAQTLGFLLASFGLMYNPLGRNPESSWVVPIMLLGVPIFDTTLVVISRLRMGQSIGSGRRDHTYHRLIAMGYSPNGSVLITHIVALLISILAYMTLYMTPIVAITIFTITILGGILVLIWFERKPTLDVFPEEFK